MNDYAKEVQQCADASARTSERTIAKLSAERDAALAWAKDQHAVADRYAAQLTAALDAVEQARADGYVQARADGYVQGLRKAANHLGVLACQTPVGHEHIGGGSSTYNWLRHHETIIIALIPATPPAKGK